AVSETHPLQRSPSESPQRSTSSGEHGGQSPPPLLPSSPPAPQARESRHVPPPPPTQPHPRSALTRGERGVGAVPRAQSAPVDVNASYRHRRMRRSARPRMVAPAAAT